MELNNIYTRRSLAEELGVSPRTVDRYRLEGWLPYRQLGHHIVFLREDIEQFITRSRRVGCNAL